MDNKIRKLLTTAKKYANESYSFDKSVDENTLMTTYIMTANTIMITEKLDELIKSKTDEE